MILLSDKKLYWKKFSHHIVTTFGPTIFLIFLSLTSSVNNRAPARITVGK